MFKAMRVEFLSGYDNLRTDARTFVVGSKEPNATGVNFSHFPSFGRPNEKTSNVAGPDGESKCACAAN